MYDKWKVITNEDTITQRLIQRNGTQLPMSGGAPFATGKFSEVIDRDGGSEEV